MFYVFVIIPIRLSKEDFNKKKPTLTFFLKKRMIDFEVGFLLNGVKINNEIVHECRSEYRRITSDCYMGLCEQSNLEEIPQCLYPIYITLYLDSDFYDSFPITIKVESNKNLKDRMHIINENVRLRGRINLPIDKHAKLCMQVYITTISDTGALCKIDFGNGTIDIHKLMNKSKSNNNNDDDNDEHDFFLKIHTLPMNPTKSTLKLSKFQFNYDSLNSTISEKIKYNKALLFSEQSDEYSNSIDNYNIVSRKMMEYLEESNIFDSSFDHFMGGVNINCYSNPSQITLDNSDLSLPMASFIYSRDIHTTEQFWIHQLTLYATRFLLSKREWSQKHYKNIMNDYYDQKTLLNHFSDYFKKGSINIKASMAMNMLSQYVQMLEYITDVTIKSNRKVNIELFGDAIASQSGDCEDFALAIYLLLKSFLKMKFHNNGYDYIFLEMQRILSAYIPLVMIEGVTSNSVQNVKEQGSDNGQDIRLNNKDNGGSNKKMAPKLKGGHSSLKMIPYNIFCKYLSTWSPSHKLTKDLINESVKFYNSNRDLVDLTILIGEGTGMLESGIINDEMEKERIDLYSHPIMEKIKKPLIPPVRSISPFYQALIYGFSERFIDTHGIGSFLFCTHNYTNDYIPSSSIHSSKQNRGRHVNNNNDNDESLLYNMDKRIIGKGCTFSDFINVKDNVMIIPNYKTSYSNESSEFDPFIIKVMKNVSKTRIPPPLLNITLGNIENVQSNSKFINDTQESTYEYKNNNTCYDPTCTHFFANEELKLLTSFLKRFNLYRSGIYTKKPNSEKLHGIISLYILEDYIDESFIMILEDHLKSIPTIYQIHAYKEYHTDNFYVYRLDLLYSQ